MRAWTKKTVGAFLVLAALSAAAFAEVRDPVPIIIKKEDPATVRPGDVIAVRPTNPVTIRPGDLLTFSQLKIPYVPVEDLTVLSLTDQEMAMLINFKKTLPLVTALKSYYLLTDYQTSVKNQLPRGSCTSFAFLGAIEAFYKRHYALELDLSEEYFIHIIHSTQPTYNPALQHENSSSWCGARCILTAWTAPGEVLMATDGLAIPEEKYAPYFGDAHAQSAVYPDHSQADLEKIVAESGIVCDSCDTTAPMSATLTRKANDNFEYDPRHIPLEARKNARYGATKVQLLSYAQTQDTTFLEQCLYGGHEVDIYLGLGKLDVGNGNFFSDGTTVSKHPDGNPIAVWPKDGVNEWQDAQGNWKEPGHAMLVVGYDKTRQLFLLKNSWGNSLPYFWVPYNYIKNKSGGGLIVLDVRDPQLGPSPEAMWLGTWNMDHDGWPGTLVIRRTRKRAQDSPGGIYTDTTLGTKARLGTYYSQDGVAHSVTGFIPYPMATQIKLYIDFGNPEGPPDPEGTPVTLKGQEFTLEMFTSPGNQNTFGNYAAGTTVWNNTTFGALISRPSAPIQIPHTPGTFALNKWKDSFRLSFSGGSTAYFKITDIASSGNGVYYSLTDTYNGTAGHHAAIDQTHTNRLFFFGSNPDVFYHTHETGVISGLGIFGVPGTPALSFAVNPKLTFTLSANKSVIASITCDTCASEGAVIHYTTDGSEPTEKSPVYTGPLILSSSDTVVKTRVFRGNQALSETAIESYQPTEVCEEDDRGAVDIAGSTGMMGDRVRIPVRLQAVPAGISSFGFEVAYDADVLHYTGYERGDLTTGFDMFEVNPLTPGRLLVGGFSARGTGVSTIGTAGTIGITDTRGISSTSGEIVRLNFEIVGGEETACYPLTLENLDDDIANLSRTGGCFCLHKACIGDLNGDGKITPADALAAFKCYLGSGPCTDCSDVNGDGSVTPKDALCLFQKYLGQASCLD
ncbi:MAG: chitobiase/beta-hexosaminidase C-terminal domain-containing protein [bacterium]